MLFNILRKNNNILRSKGEKKKDFLFITQLKLLQREAMYI